LAARFARRHAHQQGDRRFNELFTLQEVAGLLSAAANEDLPFIISRGLDANEWTCIKFVYSYRTQKERKPGQESNRIEQQYIVSGSLRASMVRLVHYTRNSGLNRQNFAYKVQNHRNLLDQNLKKSLTNKTTINTAEFNSFELQLVKGTGLRGFERQADQLVSLLERNYNVRIKCIVADFIQDLEGRVWFVNCKALQMERSVPMSQFMSLDLEDPG